MKMINKIKKQLQLWIFIISATACTSHLGQVVEVAEPASTYPDYANITIPYNIAPLNFLMRENTSALQVTVCGQQDSLTVTGGRKVCFPLNKWKRLLEKEKGQTLSVTIIAQTDGQWLQYPPLKWYVAPEKIDGFLSYRLIEPGYEVWNAIQLRERNIETFEEKVIADNNLVDGSCMNCHIYGKQNGNLSLFHLRGKNGGTILNRNGQMRKLILKDDQMVSSAVYGDFHPSGRYAVFSSNIIIPAFHAQGNKRLEVYDTASDLFVTDFDNKHIIKSPLTTDENTLETFPVFSADGNFIYYCSAPAVSLPDSLSQLHYSLCRIAFDAEKGTWGNQVDTLWNADERNASVCFPKASPDGRYLLYSVADYGTFPIWHQETDLELIDLQTGQTVSLATINSDKSDTYHSWSSNSRWFVFASKRGDGQYGKPYIAYIDSQGTVHKPFVLPQKDPEHYDNTLKSYNIPELSASPVPFDASTIKNVYQKTTSEIFK